MRFSLAAACILFVLFLSACSALPLLDGSGQIALQTPRQGAASGEEADLKIGAYMPDPTPAPEAAPSAGTGGTESASILQEQREEIPKAMRKEPLPTEQPEAALEEAGTLAATPDTVLPEPIRNALEKEGLQEEFSGVLVTFETEKLYSCIVYLQTSGGGDPALMPFTLDQQEGTICRLSDFFSKANTGWKSVIPDLVTKAALEQGMTLLYDIPPVSGDQPFYIQDGGIVLLYRPYEIATYEAGWPSFALPMQELGEYTTGAYGIGGNK